MTKSHRDQDSLRPGVAFREVCNIFT